MKLSMNSFKIRKPGSIILLKNMEKTYNKQPKKKEMTSYLELPNSLEEMSFQFKEILIMKFQKRN